MNLGDTAREAVSGVVDLDNLALFQRERAQDMRWGRLGRNLGGTRTLGVGAVAGLGAAAVGLGAYALPGQGDILGSGVLALGAGTAGLVGAGLLGRHIWKTRIGGLPGLGLGAYHAGATAVAGAATLAGGIDQGLRTLFLGPKYAHKSFTDSWLPFLKMPLEDLKAPNGMVLREGAGLSKFALNPIATRRLTGMALGYGAVKGLMHGLFNPNVPSPTAYYDGTQIRHVNDLGANGQYAQAILGASGGGGPGRLAGLAATSIL